MSRLKNDARPDWGFDPISRVISDYVINGCYHIKKS